MRAPPLMKAPVLPRDGVRLTRAERLRLTAEILNSYVLVRWWLLRSDLPSTLAAVRRPAPVASELPLSSLIRLGRGVQRALEILPLDSRCLIRSLVLTRILARRGVASTVVLAAKRHPGFAAHAWVEHAGVALLPSGSGFQRLTEM